MESILLSPYHPYNYLQNNKKLSLNSTQKTEH